MTTKRNGETRNTDGRRQAADTNGAGGGENTANTPEGQTLPGPVRTSIAMSFASCPQCGITKGGHPKLLKRYKTSEDGKILYVKCHSCGENFKVAVT